MKLRYLPLLLLTAFGVALAADLGYPLDAPAPDGRRPGGTLTQEFQAPHLAPEENKDMRRERKSLAFLKYEGTALDIAYGSCGPP